MNITKEGKSSLDGAILLLLFNGGRFHFDFLLDWLLSFLVKESVIDIVLGKSSSFVMETKRRNFRYNCKSQGPGSITNELYGFERQALER